MIAASQSPPTLIDPDAWNWWELRRLSYNLALAIAGWLAFAAAVSLAYGFGKPVWSTWQEALGSVLFMGAGYLVVIGAANVCFLLGAITESLARPADSERFRRRAHAMGVWGSFATPFLFPLVVLANLIAHAG